MTPQDASPFFRRNFISRNTGIEQSKLWLPTPDPKSPPAWLGGWMRWRRVLKKKLFFSTAAAPGRDGGEHEYHARADHKAGCEQFLQYAQAILVTWS